MAFYPSFLLQLVAGTPGSAAPYQGRLVINYPLLLTVLLVLALAAVLLVGFFLYYRFLRTEGSLEKRVADLEKSIRDLYRKQQEDLDGVLRHLHPPAPKGPAGPEEKPDLEKDTCVGKKQDNG
jgi:hypothetical protein